MANVRIKDLSTTASTTASDDFFGVDGATNGTRKLSAYSPTFGGDITSNSTSGSNIIANDPTFNHPVVQLREAGVNKAAFETVSGNAYLSTQTAGKSLYLRSGNATTALTIDSSQNTTLAGNLTVSGTGNNILNSGGGNLLIGTTTDGGQKLQVSGTAYVSSDLTSGSIIRSSGATNTIRVRGNSQYIDFTNLAENAYVNGTIVANTLSLFGNNGTGLSISSTGNATFAGSIAINNTVQTAVSVASTHKVTISIGGSTYYLLATNV